MPDEVSVAPFYDSPAVTIYCADNEQILHGQVELPLISAVVSDPPWFGFAHAQRVALALEPYDEQEEGVWLAHLLHWYSTWIPRLRQIVDYGCGRAWFFTGPTHLPAFARVAHLCGWKIQRLWLAPDAYALMQFGKPLPTASVRDITRAFEASMHPSHIDEAILGAIMAVTDIGSVLDPFMGNGGTLVAAAKSGRHSIGIEIKDALCVTAAKRVEALCVPA